MKSIAKAASTVSGAILLMAALAFPAAAPAAEGHLKLDQARVDVRNTESLQAGARTFVNYCLNCHSASVMRYNRLGDLGLSEEQIKENLLFTAEKVGEMMTVGMTRKDAKEWFGAAPPDLSVIARTRGADWLYTYLRTFYRDPTTVTGWNNLVFERVAMPHALWTLQGQPALEVREFKTLEEAEAARIQAKSFSVLSEGGEEGVRRHLLKTIRVSTPGALTPAQYDGVVHDLVNFLVWMGEPAQESRKQIGIVALLFLGLMVLLSWLLYKSYWKDVH
jgi:ubiquinol-cytochrome c reductase cytochrome c1 subunit